MLLRRQYPRKEGRDYDVIYSSNGVQFQNTMTQVMALNFFNIKYVFLLKTARNQKPGLLNMATLKERSQKKITMDKFKLSPLLIKNF